MDEQTIAQEVNYELQADTWSDGGELEDMHQETRKTREALANLVEYLVHKGILTAKQVTEVILKGIY